MTSLRKLADGRVAVDNGSGRAEQEGLGGSGVGVGWWARVCVCVVVVGGAAGTGQSGVLFGEGGEGASSFTPSFMVGHSQWRQLFEGANLEVTRPSALWLREHMCTYPPRPSSKPHPEPTHTHARVHIQPIHPNTHMPSDCNQRR